ncbi:MAG: class D beta-lactamase [Bacteroidetes bacterium]|nr:class D beta-lactamase [Bacteroidota bacterium]
MRNLSSIALLLILSACTFNTVEQDSKLETYFRENNLKGSFAIMDNGTGRFTVHDLKRFRDSGYSPAGTFAVVQALIGLQTGQITGVTYVDTDSLPVLEKKGAQAWMDSLGYGARNDNELFKINKVDSFWVDNSLKVTPDAQLGLVKQLYFGQLPFFKVYQEMVKRVLSREENTLYRLGYTTGVGTEPGGNQIGWVLGWIEENNHAYFFVLNCESATAEENWSAQLVSHVKNILKGQGFFEGNR